MEWAYVFRHGADGPSVFQRKLFNAWLMDMQQAGTYYDVVIRYARADRSLALRRREEDGMADAPELSEGNVFLLISSAEPCENVLYEAAAAYGDGVVGPLLCPLPGDGYSVFNTVTFKR